MTLAARICNRIWKVACLPGSVRWTRARERLKAQQADHLMALVRHQAATCFGVDHGFAEIRSVDDFRKRVPVRDYHDYSSYLPRVFAGQPAVLTRDRIVRLEPTSGTVSGTKFIPCTRRLHSEFQAGLNPWIWNLYNAVPDVMNGPAYWSISPAFSVTPPQNCAVPVGFGSDSDYVGQLTRRCLGAVQAVPATVGAVKDVDAHRYLTLLYLLATPELRLVSVWNPSYFTRITAMLQGERVEELLRDLHDGTVSAGLKIPSIHRRYRPMPDRAALVMRALDRWRSCRSPSPFPEIWPKLRVLSCWADAWAAEAVTDLNVAFPHAEIQPKGLLATEGLTTIPFPVYGRDGTRQWVHVLAATSHFFEFLDSDAGDVAGAHELVPDAVYEVLITTGGGLYRYRTHDRVLMQDYHQGLPRLTFVGRTARFSDLVGEKLSSEHVAQVLMETEKSFLLPCASLSLRADLQGASRRYEISISAAAFPPNVQARSAVSISVDAALKDNPYYKQARDLGQLDAPVVRAAAQETRRGPAATHKGGGLVVVDPIQKQRMVLK